MAVEEFVNADAIAQGLSAFAPNKVALDAGRIMLKRMRELASKHINFAFETTLASRSFATWLQTLQTTGYKTHLLFLSLPSVEFAIQRVNTRISLGGHDIPQPIITRRFHSGLVNFFKLYMPIVSSWKIYDNSTTDYPALLASGDQNGTIVINEILFQQLKEKYAYGS